jgi:hypothetical protein
MKLFNFHHKYTNQSDVVVVNQYPQEFDASSSSMGFIPGILLKAEWKAICK